MDHLQILQASGTPNEGLWGVPQVVAREWGFHSQKDEQIRFCKQHEFSINVQTIKILSLCNKQWLQWFISLVFSCAFLEKDFLVKTLMPVIMNFGHHFVNDTLIFSLFEFSLRLLVLFSNIVSLSLTSLHEYVNTIRIRIIIAFCYDCYIVLMSIVFITIMTP
jgi:hypothetical protein